MKENAGFVVVVVVSGVKEKGDCVVLLSVLALLVPPNKFDDDVAMALHSPVDEDDVAC